MARKRVAAAPGRTIAGVFNPDEVAAFLRGETIQMGNRSSNVAAAQWDAARGVLTLTYGDGARYEYFPVDRDLARVFADAPSKGGWRHDNFPEGGGGYVKLPD